MDFSFGKGTDGMILNTNIRTRILILPLFILTPVLFEGESYAGKTSPAQPPTTKSKPGLVDPEKITYGIEIEVDPDRYPQVLRYYDVEVKDGNKGKYQVIDPGEFLVTLPKYRGSYRELVKANQSTDTKVRYVKKQVPPSGSSQDEAAFYKQLPSELFLEKTGTVEFNQFNTGGSNPLEIKSLNSVRGVLNQFKKYIGEGDVQGHIVFDRPNHEKTQIYGSEGYVIYEHDRAILKRLQDEDDQHKRDPDFIPALNLNSAFLGPVSQAELLATRKIEGNLNQGQLSNSEHAGRAAIPVLRTDKYQPDDTKVGFELRMYDNPSEAKGPYEGSFDQLHLALDRATHHLTTQGGLNEFNGMNMYNTSIPPRFSNPPLVPEKIRRAAWLCSTLITGYVKKEPPECCKRLQNVLLQTRNPGVKLEDWQINTFLEQENKKKKGKLEDDAMDTTLYLFNEAKAQTGLECPHFIGIMNSLEPKYLLPLRMWHRHPIISSQAKQANSKAIEDQSTEFAKQFNQTMCSSEANLKGVKESLRIATADWAKKADLFKYFESYEHKQGYPELTSPRAGRHSDSCELPNLLVQETNKKLEGPLKVLEQFNLPPLGPTPSTPAPRSAIPLQPEPGKPPTLPQAHQPKPPSTPSRHGKSPAPRRNTFVPAAPSGD